MRPMLLSLCGSDIRRLYYPLPGRPPLPLGAPGHEMIGLVEDMANDSERVKRGDVALVLVPSHENAMAEYCTASIENVLPLPAGCPLEQLLMAQQLGTVIFACRRLPSLEGRVAVVIGQGSAGLFWDAMLRRKGLSKVIALEPQQARLDAGRDFGATHSINPVRTDPLQAVAEANGGQWADLVVEACGEVEKTWRQSS